MCTRLGSTLSFRMCDRLHPNHAPSPHWQHVSPTPHPPPPTLQALVQVAHVLPEVHRGEEGSSAPLLRRVAALWVACHTKLITHIMPG